MLSLIHIQIYNKQKIIDPSSPPNNAQFPKKNDQYNLDLFVDVTCSQGIRKKVDEFLSNQYQAWRESNQPKTTALGMFTCGTATNNALIMDYVRFIYSEYNIADPLGNVGSGKIVHNQIEVSQHRTPKRVGPRASTQDHIKINQQQQISQFQVNLHESKIMEEGHARRMSDPYSQTVPKKALFDSRQSTHHNHHRESSVYERGTPGSNELNITRRLDDSFNNHYRNTQPARQIQSVQLLNQGQSNRSNIQTPTYTPKQAKNTEQSNFFKFSRKINSLKKQQPIPQVFRYCIACQDAVLDANIETHQSSCKQYSKVYELDLVGILDHLSKKIEVLKIKLRNYSDTLKQDDCQQFRNMCQNMEQQCQQIIKTGNLTQEYQKNYDQAIKIGRKWALTTQQINKLRWFIKVRQEIKKKFNV